ncbi:MAG: leucyl aminopeptidase [Lysobacterales bacterium CG17_big_fil_post_rev_8_21_14_2_50_64_11]|nr:MAG: leucyl aminopeptidase [Xanthomonadales bacterium CG17_big_fil_post_rev_8_21_14_2_50_64_11]PIX60788.1 MAG: leucyl aminopeptidase [Xanthomonadales bacterium CG_4_10_14_3_um_filter_64_11]
MTLPAGFSRSTDATALYALRSDQLFDFLQTQPEPVQRWTAVNAFTAVPGSALLVPGAHGEATLVMAGISDGDDPFALAHLPYTLPEGDYRLVAVPGQSLSFARAALGWGLASYRFSRYRKSERAAARLLLDDSAHADWLAQLAACCRVRDLVNTPTEDMGPEHLEAVVREIAQRHGAQVAVIAGDDLLAHGFPAIHAVGRASHRAPRLIELSWGDPTHPAIALVGKGVCFDTGGLDIKPSDGMRHMKKDMGGAAHAIALAELVMACTLPVHLRLYLPAVENAIAANAYRPGEVVATRLGLSVEIDNTDAEGRVVLCDALAYASERTPQLILDFATLTGAARIALGPELPALFANDDALANDWLAAGQAEHDPLWRLPLWQPYQRYLKSTIADLANGGPSRMAGSVTAALYLQRFVPAALPWAHLDVFSWNDSERPGRGVGGEAQGLRAAFAMLQRRFGSR